MGTIRRQLLLNTMKLFDVLLMVAAFSVATIVGSHFSAVSLQEFLEIRVKIQNFVIFSGMLFCWHLVFSMCGAYASHRLSTRQDELFDPDEGHDDRGTSDFSGQAGVSDHAGRRRNS